MAVYLPSPEEIDIPCWIGTQQSQYLWWLTYYRPIFNTFCGYKHPSIEQASLLILFLNLNVQHTHTHKQIAIGVLCNEGSHFYSHIGGLKISLLHELIIFILSYFSSWVSIHDFGGHIVCTSSYNVGHMIYQCILDFTTRVQSLYIN